MTKKGKPRRGKVTVQPRSNDPFGSYKPEGCLKHAWWTGPDYEVWDTKDIVYIGLIKGPGRTRATLSLKRKLEEKLSKTMMKEMVWAFSCARD